MSNNQLYNDFYKLGIYFSSVFSESNQFTFYHLFSEPSTPLEIYVISTQFLTLWFRAMLES